ncbi:hypothetical protein [Alteraurantiacibacter buctensis]|uniref:MarR family transcriptional regulator n=1 Tax=Alteraurantiacibacter buctensis TaxID=1503981 RepID=A0A844YT76_9SPHN|nr:hypothetical protein [Alteraurantiacibacter buctensis]MXO70749.1 hypothetical protein [Alteraurantiacibacter buctensis]
MGYVDFPEQQFEMCPQLRRLAQIVEEGFAAQQPVRKPYATPRLQYGGTVPADLLADLRARRNALFGADLFGEPGWDMLLELYRARMESRRLSIKSLAIASGAPATTAGRYIAMLIDGGLAERMEDPADGRRALIGITRKGFAKMDELLMAA